MPSTKKMIKFFLENAWDCGIELWLHVCEYVFGNSCDHEHLLPWCKWGDDEFLYSSHAHAYTHAHMLILGWYVDEVPKMMCK